MKTESAIRAKTRQNTAKLVKTNPNFFQGEERPSEKGEKQLELGPMAGESKLIVPAFSDFLPVQRPPRQPPVQLAGH